MLKPESVSFNCEWVARNFTEDEHSICTSSRFCYGNLNMALGGGAVPTNHGIVNLHSFL